VGPQPFGDLDGERRDATDPARNEDLLLRHQKRISVRGFFLSDPEHAPKIRPIIVEAAELLRSGRLHAPAAATYPLSAIKDAVAHVERDGKVLLDAAAS
jgi:NADPH:quinone reductase-like Zn-dependent oxidoreductase